jgi:hypothetical protein
MSGEIPFRGFGLLPANCFSFEDHEFLYSENHLGAPPESGGRRKAAVAARGLG